jgi:hypothetical protein
VSVDVVPVSVDEVLIESVGLVEVELLELGGALPPPDGGTVAEGAGDADDADCVDDVELELELAGWVGDPSVPCAPGVRVNVLPVLKS